jgi:hypothetical protein
MPEHQRNHPHHHSAAERAGHEDAPIEPYPYVYSKDLLDPRRFLRPGEPYGPASVRGPSSWVLWLLGAILALIIGAGLLSIILGSLVR